MRASGTAESLPKAVSRACRNRACTKQKLGKPPTSGASSPRSEAACSATLARERCLHRRRPADRRRPAPPQKSVRLLLSFGIARVALGCQSVRANDKRPLDGPPDTITEQRLACLLSAGGFAGGRVRQEEAGSGGACHQGGGPRESAREDIGLKIRALRWSPTLRRLPCGGAQEMDRIAPRSGAGPPFEREHPGRSKAPPEQERRGAGGADRGSRGQLCCDHRGRNRQDGALSDHARGGHRAF